MKKSNSSTRFALTKSQYFSVYNLVPLYDMYDKVVLAFVKNLNKTIVFK